MYEWTRPLFLHDHALCLSLPVGYKTAWRRLRRRQEDDPLDIHLLIFTHQAVQMDRGMSVSLWCEEVEDQDLEQDQDQDLNQSQTEAPAQGLARGPSQLRAAWDPTVSGHRVIQRLLHMEERYMPSTLYVTLIQRDPERREELAKWALEVCCECGCDEPVFPLSVSLMDRFLSASLSLPVSPYCLAASCILIASKLTECDNVTADTLCAAAEYSFLPSSLRVSLTLNSRPGPKDEQLQQHL
ncbi:hypothetical protein INR49_030441 [Caranx melampygus]|nr:hypothetical protein INR49_030441 [Caranx melampygus]